MLVADAAVEELLGGEDGGLTGPPKDVRELARKRREWGLGCREAGRGHRRGAHGWGCLVANNVLYDTLSIRLEGKHVKGSFHKRGFTNWGKPPE